MKKIYFLFLMALLPLVTYAAPVVINGIYYNIVKKAKTAEVTSHPNKYIGKVVIPKTVTYEGVVCNVTSIGDYAFNMCRELTSVTIPNSVTCIGESAFYECTDLHSITIPNSVTTIGNYAFEVCTSLTSVHISDLASWCRISIGNIYGNPLYYAHHLFLNGFEIKNLTIPNSVTSINEGAFYGCSGLTSITIPDIVTSIGSSAFGGCSGLTSVTIGNSVTSIGGGAFKDCTGLTSVTIPNSVKSIGSWAFYECSGLTSVTIPNSVTCIGESAFYGTLWYNNQPDGIIYAGKVLYKYKGTMPEGTKIIIEKGTHSIVDYAFAGCSGLTSVTIPNSVTSIGWGAFRDCSGLTSITIPNSVTDIGVSAFKGCSNLTSITIPNSVTSIEQSTFQNCSSLKEIVIPNSVTSIGSSAFYSCSSLKTITIPNSVTSIGVYAFYGCSSLKTITIPNGVTFISNDTFASCSGLTSVTIPNSVTHIGPTAFSDCIKMTDFYCFAEDVPNTFNSSFQDSNIGNATLHVPAGSVGAYKAKSPWSGFKDVVAIETVKVKLNKTKVTLEKGKTVTLKATITPSTFPDKNVTWKSSNKKVATVTSAGKVKAIKAGTATITCTSEITGEKATCKVTVFEGSVTLDKTEVTLQKGKTVTLKATVEPTTLEDKSVTWTSSNTKVATVTTAGKVKGVKAGTATITCTANATGMSATCKVTVINGTVTLNKTEAYLEKGKTMTLKATLTPTDLSDKSVTWTSSDKSIATVSSSGKVKGVKYGTATITCTSKATGASATCKVTVGKVVINMSEFTLKKSRSVTLVATVYPTTLTDKSVTWKSSDKSIATVTSSGKVKGIAAGTATITCTSVATGLKGTCTVTVLATTESRSTEGDDDNVTGIENLEEAPVATEPYDVYDLSGRKVRHQVNSLDGLPDGIYIVNGRKILKK